MCLLHLSIASSLWLCWALWLTRGSRLHSGIWMIVSTPPQINKVHVHKDHIIYVQYFSCNIKQREKKKNLRAVIYCTSLSDVLGCIPLLPLCFIVNICLTDVRGGMGGRGRGGGGGCDIRYSPGRHPNAQALVFHLKVIKKWWKCIHYKVMMKFPAGSLERQYFQ